MCRTNEVKFKPNRARLLELNKSYHQRLDHSYLLDERCPECGSYDLFDEDCVWCPSCGWADLAPADFSNVAELED